jgi:hypothetical protein
MPLHIAARRAQEEVLPPERHRRIRQHKDVERWMPANPSSRPPVPRYPRAIKPALAVREKPAAKVEAPAPVPEPVAAVPVLTQDTVKRLHGTLPDLSIDPAIVQAVAAQITPAILATLTECAARLTGAFEEALRHAGSLPQSTIAPPSHPKPPPPPRSRLPRVCIVGLINQQENDVSAAFAGVIEFVFVKAQKTGGGGHGGAGMLTKSASSDLVLAMTDFIGHDVEASAKHLHVPFERVKGSVSALKRWLTEWLAEGVKH